MKILKLLKKKQEKRNWIVITSVVLNIIFLVGLTGIALREDYPTKLKRILTRSEIFVGGKKNIVMLGNSLTAGGNWVELLDRRDIANKGVGGNITQQFIDRIDDVIGLQPEICFIEGGINDLHRGISEEVIVENLQKLIDTLQKNNIKPVLTTVSYITKKRMMMNDRVKGLNELIFQLADKNNVTVLDLNEKLSDGDFLKDDYAVPDGLHFNEKTYAVWKDEVIKILHQETKPSR